MAISRIQLPDNTIQDIHDARVESGDIVYEGDIKTVNNTSLLGSGNIDTTELYRTEYADGLYSDIKAAITAGKIPYLTADNELFIYNSGGSSNSAIYFTSINRTSTKYRVVYSDGTWSNGDITLLSEARLKQSLTLSSSESANDYIPSIAAINTALGDYAPKASPALTGTPTAPTASTGTNTTQIATTAFVQNSIAGKIPFIIYGRYDQQSYDIGEFNYNNLVDAISAGNPVFLTVDDAEAGETSQTWVLYNITEGEANVASTELEFSSGKKLLWIRFDPSDLQNGVVATQSLDVQEGTWIPNLSRTITGNGNAITNITVSNHSITATKGSTFLTASDITGKQDTLVSGTNIRTINGISLLGNGDINIPYFRILIYDDNPSFSEVGDSIDEDGNCFLLKDNMIYLLSEIDTSTVTATFTSIKDNVVYWVTVTGETPVLDFGTYTLEQSSNKVISLSSSSTDTQYPSAKCVYDLLGDVETLINAL